MVSPNELMLLLVDHAVICLASGLVDWLVSWLVGWLLACLLASHSIRIIQPNTSIYC